MSYYDKRISEALDAGRITEKEYRHLHLCPKLIADCKRCTKLVPKAYGELEN